MNEMTQPVFFLWLAGWQREALSGEGLLGTSSCHKVCERLWVLGYHAY